MTNEKTTIQVSVNTKNRLAKLGLKGETFDSIILRLLAHRVKKRRQKGPPPGREETIYPI